MIWEKRGFQFSILMVLAFIWGSSFILMKNRTEEFQPRAGRCAAHLTGFAGAVAVIASAI